ncbi:MAG: 5'/3'-nucleotidase SurE [Bacteroidales bacterium]|nr:5'/3'-nucleotidase SurE [Bacteroidales bacterium]
MEADTQPQRPLILVTNDDGIFAKGIKELVKAIQPLGDVVVVAPDKPQSGKSHAVTLDMPLWYMVSKFDNANRAYKCTGTPSDCIKIALYRIMDRKPDLIISGINHGSNSSINILYSGTMGAAMEGAIHGIPSIGFSLLSYNSDADFAVAAKYAAQITEKTLSRIDNLPFTCLNVNIPCLPENEIKGIKVVRQSRGEWIEDFVRHYHPSNKRPYYWLTGEYHDNEPESQDTDMWMLNNGYIAIQPVTVDCTDYAALKTMNDENWF